MLLYFRFVIKDYTILWVKYNFKGFNTVLTETIDKDKTKLDL